MLLKKNRAIRHFQVFCQKMNVWVKSNELIFQKFQFFSLYSVKTMPLIQQTYSSFSFDFLILSTFIALDTGFRICNTHKAKSDSETQLVSTISTIVKHWKSIIFEMEMCMCSRWLLKAQMKLTFPFSKG